MGLDPEEFILTTKGGLRAIGGPAGLCLNISAHGEKPCSASIGKYRHVINDKINRENSAKNYGYQPFCESQ